MLKCASYWSLILFISCILELCYMHTLLEGSNLLRSPYNHFYGWLLFVITSRQIKLESCGWSQIVDFEEIYSMVYDRLWFWPFLPELCPNKGVKGWKSPFWYNNLNYITQKHIFLKRRPKEYLDMIQNSFVYLRRAQNQRKTQSFSISISAVALRTCERNYLWSRLQKLGPNQKWGYCLLTALIS